VFAFPPLLVGAACAATAAPFMDVAGAIDGPLQHLPARRV